MVHRKTKHTKRSVADEYYGTPEQTKPKRKKAKKRKPITSNYGAQISGTGTMKII